MNDTVVQLRPRQLEKLAESFVKDYMTHDENYAASRIEGKYEEGEQDRLSRLIRIEFLVYGYTFEEVTDAELQAAKSLRISRGIADEPLI